MSSIFKGFNPEIINFQGLPRDFDKSLLIVSCTATERHRRKELKFHRL